MLRSFIFKELSQSAERALDKTIPLCELSSKFWLKFRQPALYGDLLEFLDSIYWNLLMTRGASALDFSGSGRAQV
jgi:hypothetical protein